MVKVLHDAFKKGLEEPSYAAAMATRPGVFYLSSEDYQKFALQQIDEARRFIAELGLKGRPSPQRESIASASTGGATSARLQLARRMGAG